MSRKYASKLNSETLRVRTFERFTYLYLHKTQNPRSKAEIPPFEDSRKPYARKIKIYDELVWMKIT